MSSSRLPWNRSPNRFSIALAELRESGRPVHDLTVTDPVSAGLGVPREDLLAALDDPELAAYGPDPRGLERTRRAVAATFRPLEVDPRDVVLTASTSEAYGYLFKLLCDPGDEVLVPVPSYPLFEFLAALEGVRLRTYPLCYDGAWHVDLDALRRAAGPRVRAVIVVHPNNPTGSFLDVAEVDGIVEVAARAGAALIADEVFGAYALTPRAGRAGTLAGERRVPTFVLGGASKSLASPQLKLGWIVVAGPGPGRDATLARLDLIADTYLSASHPAQIAGAALLTRGDRIRAPVLDRVRGSLDRLRAGLADTSGSVLWVEGGWSAIVRHPATRSGEERALAWMREDGVVVQPGYLFDLPGESHVVVGLLTPPRTLEAGIRALRRA